MFSIDWSIPLSNLILTVILAIPLYLIPGYLVLWLCNMRGMSRWSRMFFSLCVSLVIVPVSFIFFGNKFNFIPGLFSYLLLIMFLLALGLILRRLKRRPMIQMSEIASPALTVEVIVAWVAIFLYAILANLPRVAMFVQGAMTLRITPWDETWHLTQLVSVARTGIPPAHYFFPEIRLVYYYASWIYPAVLGNMPFIQVSLARAMAVQAFIQTFAFLGLVYYLLLYNFKTWWVRLMGVSFFTIMGGFDLFATLPSIKLVDTWQSRVGWLVSDMQISQFSTLFAWVPQHMAGGMAFLLGLFLLKNIKTTAVLKAAILGLLFSFCFLTSTFVFFSFALVIAFAILFNVKSFLSYWKKSFVYITIIGIIFLLVVWYSLILYAGHGSSLGWRNFHITVFKQLLPNSPRSIFVDRAMTILGFPLLASWIGIIEIGLPFVLYLVWLLKRMFSSRRTILTTEIFLMAVFPLVYLFLIFLIEDKNGGGNLAMRGIIPAQILINCAALSLLDDAHEIVEQPVWRRWLFIYLFICFFVAQGLSSYAETLSDAASPINSVMGVNFGPHNTPDWQSGKGTPWAWPSALGYIHWLNLNTPSNALIIEDGCPSGDTDVQKYRWLERNRFLDPVCASTMGLFPEDQNFISPSEWHNLVSQASKYPDVMAFYDATKDPGGHTPVYYIDRGSTVKSEWGSPVYQDDYVSIYRIK
jgi:hypothetical protein